MSDYSNPFETKPIEKVKNDIRQVNKDINKIKIDALKTWKEIEIIYGQTADAAMAGEFSLQRDNFKKEMDDWSEKIKWTTIPINWATALQWSTTSPEAMGQTTTNATFWNFSRPMISCTTHCYHSYPCRKDSI